MSFDPVEHPMALTQPKMLSDKSAWIEHIPFAFALIDMCRPATLVELGTRKGDSYCAFCQAIDALRLPTRGYAVDTWQGDPHVGLYGPEILAQLRAHHDPLYGRFSTLVQKDFASACADFQDGSIDLLHIDGMHDYDSVKRDFEMWQPKLSDRAVVLFHDTHELARGFGVYRLWSELTSRHPGFEFEHGHGLGVLAAGRNPPERLIEFISDATKRPEAVRRFFAYAGRQILILRTLWKLIDSGTRMRGMVIELRARAGDSAPSESTDVNVARRAPVRYFSELSKDLESLIRRGA